MKATYRRYAVFAACVSTALTTCTGYFSDPPNAATTMPSGPMPFEAVHPASYVAKIKNLLTGLPPTQAEIDAVAHDPTALRGLIDGWLRMPQAESKIQTFFANAFQQTHLGSRDFASQIRQDPYTFPGPLQARILQSFQESFARTVWQLVMVQGHPFTEVLTTRSYMVTPVLLSEILFMSEWDSSMGHSDVYSREEPTLAVTLEHNQGPIPIEQTLDPSSPNYLHFYSDVPIEGSPGNLLPASDPGHCSDPQPMPVGYAFAPNQTGNIFNILHGALPNFSLDVGPGNTLGHGCLTAAGMTSPYFTDSDLGDWRMVTFRQPNPGERRLRFWDLPALRTVSDVGVPQQRVGFFTTPAFFANWPTNNNNQHRVTMNQTLIVALGASFDSSQTIVVQGLPTSTTFNAEHASNPACASCHVALDPMRQFFTRAFDYNYMTQVPSALEATYGTFTLGGVQQSGSTLYDLGDIMASHPRFAPAWVQKVCAWANSAACADNDPQLVRIAAAFQNSHFNFRTMLIDVLSSPVVTGAQPTVTAATNGETVTIARANHFCVALQNRLGVPGICNVTSTAGLVSANIPSDGYARGATEPFLPTDPQLFFRGAVENLCREISVQVVDAGPVSRYSTNNVPWALSDMVQTVMAITPGNARYAPLLQVLSDHFRDGLAAGASASDALRSTFTLACTSPTSVAIGL